MSNIISNDHADDKPDDKEWQAQERAMREERSAAPLPDDTRNAHYRLIAHALREAPSIALGEDFAKHVAKQAMKATASKHEESHFERNSLYVLGTLLALCCVITLITFGDSLYHLLDSRLGAWCLALTMCAVLTQSIDSLQRQFHSIR